MENEFATREAADFGTRLQAWRTSVLNTVLMVVAIAAMGVVALDVHRATIDPSLLLPVLASSFLYAIIAGLTFLRRLDTRVRAVVTIVVGYTAAIVVFARGGLLGDEQVLLLALPVISLIVLGRRFGIAATALSLLLLALMRLITSVGALPPGIAATRATHPTDHLVPGIVFGTTLAGLMTLQWRATVFRESIIDENVHLWRTSERLRAFSENIVRRVEEGIILTDSDGLITFVNPNGARALGHAPAELKGLSLSTIVTAERVPLGSRGMPGEDPDVAARYETHLRTRTAGYIPVIWSTRAFSEDEPSGSTLAVFTDITDLKRAEDALRTSEETARALLNATTESMILTDAKGRVLDLNETAANRFGSSPEELVGTTLDDATSRTTIPSELMEARAEALRDAVKSASPARFEDGYAGLTFDHNFYPIRGEDGRVTRLALFSRDITAARLSEERAMRAERLAAMGRVAATLAHEINNPLQAIRSNLELLQAFDLDPEERRQRVEVGLEAIDRLSAASQRALQLRTTSPEDRQVVPLCDPVRRTLALMDEPLRQAGITVTVDLPTEPVLVRVAVDQIVQVLVNLVVNAIDAINNSGWLHVSVRGDDRCAVVEVSNGGPPLTSEQSAHLFEPHFTTKAGHVGLGLSLSQDIVVLHGGTICAENLEGEEGVRFRIRLPLPCAEGS